MQRTPHRLTVAVAALGCAVALAACDAEETERPVQRPEAPEPGGTPTAPAEGVDGASPPTADTTDAAAEVPDGLDWVLDDLNGGQVVGADLAGRDVILWFWAPW